MPGWWTTHERHDHDSICDTRPACWLLYIKQIQKALDRLNRFRERQYELVMRKLAVFGDEDELEQELGTVVNKVKIMIGLFQVISQFTVNFRLLEWPTEFKEFTAKLKLFNMNFFDFQAVGCVLRTSFPDTFFIMTVTPLSIIALTIFMHLFARQLGMKNVMAQSYVVPKVTIAVLFLVYPGTSNTVLRMLTCRSTQMAANFCKLTSTSSATRIQAAVYSCKGLRW